MARAKVHGKLAKLQARMAKLEELKLDLERREDERYLALIKQSGLYDLDVTNAEVLAGLKDLAGRFRGTANERTQHDHHPAHAAQPDVSTPDACHGQG